MERSRVGSAAPLAVIVALAALLRLYKITAVALWFDESISLALISRSWAHLWTRIADGIGPPLYFVVLKLWCGLFGQPLLSLRSLSVAFGVASVWFVYRFVQKAFGDSPLALLAALLLAVNPFQIQYARETRMYAMGVCLVLMSSVLLVRALRDTRRVNWLAYGAAAAACVYTHYYLAFAIAAQALVVAATALIPNGRRVTRSSRRRSCCWPCWPSPPGRPMAGPHGW